MKRVYKYPVAPGTFSHIMTERVDMLDVQIQHGEAQLWALVDISAPEQWRHFITAGTGHNIEQRVIGHVGTFQLDGGDLIFHVFEVHP